MPGPWKCSVSVWWSDYGAPRVKRRFLKKRDWVAMVETVDRSREMKLVGPVGQAAQERYLGPVWGRSWPVLGVALLVLTEGMCVLNEGA